MLLIPCAPCGAQDWRPERAIEIVAGSAAGGAQDRTARAMQRILKSNATLRVWGNGLGVRFTKPVVEASGMKADTPVNITVQKGRIVIEPLRQKPRLTEMLAAFDPKRHGGEAMAFSPLGKEVL